MHFEISFQLSLIAKIFVSKANRSVLVTNYQQLTRDYHYSFTWWEKVLAQFLASNLF